MPAGQEGTTIATGNVVRVGKETTSGTAATQFTNVPCDFKSTLKQDPIVPEEWRSSQDEHFMIVAGTQHQEWSVGGSLYYDTFPLWLLAFLGAPATTAVATDTTAKDHVFTPQNTPPSLTTQWNQDVQAYQSTYSVVDDLSIKFGGEDQLTYDLKGFGFPETEIAAPTSSFSQVLPFAHWQGVVTLGGAAFDGLVSMDLSYKRNRKPAHRVRGQRGPKRMDIGRRGGTVKITIDFENVAEYNRAKNAEKRAMAVKFTDPAATIGSTSVNPSLKIVLPKLHFANSHEIDLGGDTPLLVLESNIYYDATAGHAIQATVRNTTTGY